MGITKTDVIREITKETARDKQKRVGPSQLGNPCPKCLARHLMGEAWEGRGDFSLYPWQGTAVHAYLETTTFPAAEHELKLFCGTVPGYGDIYGTTDMYVDGSVVDWKLVGKKKIAEYRLKPKLQYRYQAQIYARGIELSGREAKDINIVFIPRDSGEVRDIYIHTEAYQPDMAEKVLERAGLIYAQAQEKGWEYLPSDPDCWDCNYNY